MILEQKVLHREFEVPAAKNWSAMYNFIGAVGWSPARFTRIHTIREDGNKKQPYKNVLSKKIGALSLVSAKLQMEDAMQSTQI